MRLAIVYTPAALAALILAGYALLNMRTPRGETISSHKNR